MPKRWFEPLWLSIILACYLALGSLYAMLTPPWQAPDEPAHYNYVRHLAEHGHLPVLRFGDYPHAYLEQLKAARFPSEMSIAPLRYESWQPPLYYLLALPVYRLFQGHPLALRMFSMLLGAGVVVTTYQVLHYVFPTRSALALGTAAFVAFVPMHLAVLSSVNNDVLAELLIGLSAWYVLASVLQSGRRLGWQWQLLGGVLLGLGLLTKLTYYYIAVPLFVLGLWWRHHNLVAIVREYPATWGLAFLLALPWYGRNVVLYGWPDLLGKWHHDAVVVGQLRTADYLSQMGWAGYLQHFFTTTFQSFWGQFGWMAVPMDARMYLLLGILSALAASGAGLKLVDCRRWQPEARPILLLAIWLALTAGGYLYYNVTFVQFQGRYLFPGLIPLGLFIVTGWRAILSRRWALWGAGVSATVTFGVAVSGLLRGDLDKWGLVIGLGIATGLTLCRWLPQGWDTWLWTLPLLLLAGLAGYSVFAFIVPNL
ncbi:MAG: DUF2142 domain-containing protein [Anaerolineae bacterium]|nr:DUF2142 domain-containing protein [Anaerolineae bacterium]MDW8071824.1 DUF2142 domain-containing protein [Anaerolineae bacterium]